MEILLRSRPPDRRNDSLASYQYDMVRFCQIPSVSKPKSICLLMKSSRSPLRSIGRTAWMCSFALLTIGLFAPSETKAAHCGRYVMAEARFERDLTQLLMGDSADHSSLPLSAPPTPCKGAFCSTPSGRSRSSAGCAIKPRWRAWALPHGFAGDPPRSNLPHYAR